LGNAVLETPNVNILSRINQKAMNLAPGIKY